MERGVKSAFCFFYRCITVLLYTTSMHIKFNGQYDKELFFKAVRVANQPSRNARIMYVFVALVFGVMLVTTTKNVAQTGDLAGNLISIGLLLVMGFLLYQAYVPPYLGARKMWTPELARRLLKGAVTKSGITYNFPKGDKVYQWSDINRLRTTPSFVTMVALSGMLLIFPRRFFKTDADWERFRSVVESNVVSVKKK